MSEFTPKVTARILDRDAGRCFWCHAYVLNGVRGIDYSIHHRCPRGQGGSKSPWMNEAANGLVLCGTGTEGCHGYFESHRQEAIGLGIILSTSAAFARPENRPANRTVTDSFGRAWWLTVDGRKEPTDGPTPF